MSICLTDNEYWSLRRASSEAGTSPEELVKTLVADALDSSGPRRVEISGPQHPGSPGVSPMISGDRRAAAYAGYKCPRAFNRWARRVRIRPVRRGWRKFWLRSDLDKAMSRGD